MLNSDQMDRYFRPEEFLLYILHLELVSDVSK